MLAAQLPQITRFKGLNNVSDPLRVGFGWLAQADNVDVTDTGSLVARSGYTQAQSRAFGDAYGTIDESRMYLTVPGQLTDFNGNALRTLVSTAKMYWAEVNDHVFFNNGTDSGIIRPDGGVIDWAWRVPAIPAVAIVTGNLPAGQYQVCLTFTLPDGRETGPSDPVQIDIADGQALQVSGIEQVEGLVTNLYIAPANSDVYQFAESPFGAATVWNASPDALGMDLFTNLMKPLPLGCDVIQVWGGQVYAAQYFPSDDQTVVWFSQPLGFHLFDLASDFFTVPGRVTMLAPVDTGLIVGTDKRIYAYTSEGITTLAPYGCVPGQHWSLDDDGMVIFWTDRGVCQGLPFSNLTQRNVSVAPGVHAGGAIVRSGGQKRYLVSIQQGGTAYNQFA